MCAVDREVVGDGGESGQTEWRFLFGVEFQEVLGIADGVVAIEEGGKLFAQVVPSQ